MSRRTPVLTFPAIAIQWSTSAAIMARSARETIAEAIELMSSISGGADAQEALGRADTALREALEELAVLVKDPRINLNTHDTRHVAAESQGDRS